MNASTPSAAPSRWPTSIGLDGGVSVLSIGVFLLAFVLLYLPAYVQLAHTVWATDEQGHGPLILGASAWLFWTRREHIFAGAPRPAVFAGFMVLALALAMFAIGHSQSIIEAEVASEILVLAAGLLLLHGTSALRRSWFALFFLVFMVPLPGAVVQAVTLPLKSAVSVVAEQVLYWAGYPIGRTGVTLTIGPYQLLVADACSGLNSLFTLESLGMLYMNIMNYHSKARNVMLAVMIVPISFFSNVTRVLILVLMTFYFGDEVGQGFAHGFAGVVLFSVAMTLTYGFDRFLAAHFDDQGGARGPRN
jgi:exosortase B